jgi:hypothetical protein
MDEKFRFISRHPDGAKIATLRRKFGISRAAGHKIIEPYRDSEMEAFTDHSRKPYPGIASNGRAARET